jgi:hypothetical protein
MKKQAILLFLFFLTVSTYAQGELNEYKLAIIPTKFEFQKEKNQYRLNSTLKLFFQQRGFEVYYDDEILTKEAAVSNCNKIFVSLLDNSTSFTSKLKMEIKDCTNKVLFVSEEGESREKSYGKAYNEALVTALKSFEKAKYKYSEKTKSIEAKPEAQTNSVKEVPADKLKPIAMSLQKTSNPDVYIASFGEKNGVALKKEDGWYFEYYQNDILVSEKLNMKL